MPGTAAEPRSPSTPRSSREAAPARREVISLG